MNSNLPAYLLVLILLLGTLGCSENSSTPLVESSHGPTAALKLQADMKVLITQQEFKPNDPQASQAITRVLDLEAPQGMAGMTFFWNNQPNTPSQPSSGLILLGSQSGQMSLANLTNARQMTPPVFWPSGELYLSNSTGVWLSDIAFEELKRNGKTQWDPGLLKNPLLGSLQEVVEKDLTTLQNQILTDPKRLKASESIASQGLQKYPLKINGQKTEVEVLTAQNWLAAYKILNNAQNPLVMELTLMPEATPGEILFSRLGLMKGLVEYQVKEIQIEKK